MKEIIFKLMLISMIGCGQQNEITTSQNEEMTRSSINALSSYTYECTCNGYKYKVMCDFGMSPEVCCETERECLPPEPMAPGNIGPGDVGKTY